MSGSAVAIVVALSVGALCVGACSAQAQSSGAQASVSRASNAATHPATHCVIVYRPGPAWRAGEPVERQNLRAHGRYMQSLLDDGRLFAAGALMDEGAGGMVILNVARLDEARAIMAADPAVIDGVLVGEARPWRPSFVSDRSLTSAR